MECEELREEQRRKDEQLRITEAQLGAIKQHRINPEDYVTKTQYETLTNEYLTLKQVRDKLVSEQKSKEVRLGAIAETLAPFLDGFPYDPKKLRALGSPIDYIAFEDDCVVLIEIKSGDSKLNKNQKNIKDIVESGNVRFETYRIDKDGVHGD
jgi:predicted Holliday junction resolvase-like endonuclease